MLLVCVFSLSFWSVIFVGSEKFNLLLSRLTGFSVALFFAIEFCVVALVFLLL